MSLNPKRTVAELKELRALTGDENGSQRVAWTDRWLKAREWFTSKLEKLPIEHHYDAAANHWVTLAGASEKALLLGGHLDSVPNGGWLDGCLGVMSSLEMVEVNPILDQGNASAAFAVELVQSAFGKKIL